ncbi:hypothetical protein [Wukongibacter sp. M2B1]|uniref:hypothetical protein n=1 Tax=Wukongibacter sp. M2B1 TaxID=3088895 RepID=UPI003D7AC148
MVPNKANDYTVLGIQKIFEHINNFDYEEAFYLSSQIMEKQDNGDTLFHEWVKSLVEFYSCNKKDTAIKLLEKIKPDVIENEIHFRIVNSLMNFYREIKDKDNFMKYRKILYLNLHKIKDKEFLVKVMYNISNGFYTFRDYDRALEYAENSIEIAKNGNVFNIFFSLAFMIKIMCLFYLGRTLEAESLKEIFLDYLKVVGNVNHKDYLENALEEFYNLKRRELVKC